MVNFKRDRKLPAELRRLGRRFQRLGRRGEFPADDALRLLRRPRGPARELPADARLAGVDRPAKYLSGLPMKSAYFL